MGKLLVIYYDENHLFSGCNLRWNGSLHRNTEVIQCQRCGVNNGDI